MNVWWWESLKNTSGTKDSASLAGAENNGESFSKGNVQRIVKLKLRVVGFPPVAIRKPHPRSGRDEDGRLSEGESGDRVHGPRGWGPFQMKWSCQCSSGTVWLKKWKEEQKWWASMGDVRKMKIQLLWGPTGWGSPAKKRASVVILRVAASMMDGWMNETTTGKSRNAEKGASVRDRKRNFFFPNRLSFKGQNNESAAHKAVGRMQSEEKTIRAGNKDLGAVVPFTEASHLCLGCQGPDRDDKSWLAWVQMWYLTSLWLAQGWAMWPGSGQWDSEAPGKDFLFPWRKGLLCLHLLPSCLWPVRREWDC